MSEENAIRILSILAEIWSREHGQTIESLEIKRGRSNGKNN